jgi:hypothetical protein
MIELTLKKFKKMFPNLCYEVEGVKIPTVIDHFERCKSEEEAIEIVDFFERKGEITPEMASFLRNNISKFSDLFGTRSKGDYERRGLID